VRVLQRKALDENGACSVERRLGLRHALGFRKGTLGRKKAKLAEVGRRTGKASGITQLVG